MKKRHYSVIHTIFCNICKAVYDFDAGKKAWVKLYDWPEMPDIRVKGCGPKTLQKMHAWHGGK